MLDGNNLKENIDFASVTFNAWTIGLDDTESMREALTELFKLLDDGIKICKGCGKVFVPKKPKHDYCNAYCWYKYGYTSAVSSRVTFDDNDEQLAQYVRGKIEKANIVGDSSDEL